MKEKFLFALASLACGVALSQAPAGTVARPSQETNPTATGGPAAKAQMKVDEKKGAMPMAGGSMPMAAGGTMGMGMDMKAMDTNGDGMISKKEWDAHHSTMWNKMKPKMKKGMMSMPDMEAMMKGGPS